jgi:hypothetical protein
MKVNRVVTLRKRSKKLTEAAKAFRERLGIREADIGKPGFYLVDRVTGQSLMEHGPVRK